MVFKNYIVKRDRDTGTFIFRKLSNGPSEGPDNNNSFDLVASPFLGQGMNI